MYGFCLRKLRQILPLYIPPPFTKNKESRQKFKERDLTKRTASDKILIDKTFDIPKNPKYDGYQRALSSMFYNFLDKKPSGGTVEKENISDKELP